jgi:hypothetical protein
MLKLCGKAVRILRKNRRKSLGQSSPGELLTVLLHRTTCEKVALMHSFMYLFPLISSTPKMRRLPLGEHNFYPVSTAPTITFIKGNKRKAVII